MNKGVQKPSICFHISETIQTTKLSMQILSCMLFEQTIDHSWIYIAYVFQLARKSSSNQDLNPRPSNQGDDACGRKWRRMRNIPKSTHIS